MNQKVIIFIIIFVVIIIVGLVSYFLIGKKSTTNIKTSQMTPPSTIGGNTTPIPAQCKSGTTTFSGGQQASDQANDDSNYTFSNTITRLGSSIKNSIEGFMFPERFALSSGLIPNTNKNALNSNKWYTSGSLDSTKQVQSVSPAINNGSPCVPFPDKVYRELPATQTTYSLVSEMDWFPYGATANFVKSTIGVTTLATAITYANNNGYAAFSFNENPMSTNPNSNDPNILFFREADINPSTFWTNGAAVPRFRVYAIGFSKLRTTMACPGNQTRGALGVCRLPCQINQYRDGNEVCQWNPCPANSTLNTTTGDCNCNANFQKAPGSTGRTDPCYPVCTARCSVMQSNGTCPNKVCPPEQSLDANCNCQWNLCTISGQVRGTDNVCRCSITNQTVQNGRCQYQCTIAGQVRGTDDVCKCGIANQTVQSGRCQDPCPAEQTRDPNGVCRWNPCPAQQTRINGVCQLNPCPAEQTRDPNGVCRWNLCTIQGQVRDFDNVCRCPSDKIVSGSSCVCPSGSTDKGWYCECPGYKTLSNGVCQCPDSSTEIDGVCQCPAGSVIARIGSYSYCLSTSYGGFGSFGSFGNFDGFG
jgi:hypothetical protein